MDFEKLAIAYLKSIEPVKRKRELFDLIIQLNDSKYSLDDLNFIIREVSL